LLTVVCIDIVCVLILATVAVLLVMSSVLFFNQTTYPIGSMTSPNSMSVADVNNDNKPDICVANSAGNSMGVFLLY